MITPHLPPEVSGQQTAGIVEQSRASMDESVFMRENETPIIKSIILRYLTQYEINLNQNQQIQTGVVLYDLQTNRAMLNHNENIEHFAASVNKLPITLLVLEELRAGRTSLNTVLTWQETDRRAGAGNYDVPNGPLSASVGDVLTDLLTRSGNTAARILVNGLLGGPATTNQRLAAIPELVHTRLIPLDATRFFMGNTTPKESLFVMRRLMSSQDQYGQFIKQALVNNIFTDIGVKSQLAGNDYIVLVNKIGQLNDPDGNNRHDVGIIYNTRTQKAYGFSYLTTSPSSSETATVRAEESLRNMGRYYLRFSGDKPAQQLQATMAEQAAPEQGRMIY